MLLSFIQHKISNTGRNEKILSTGNNVEKSQENLLELDVTLSQNVFESINEIPISEEERVEANNLKFSVVKNLIFSL